MALTIVLVLVLVSAMALTIVLVLVLVLVLVIVVNAVAAGVRTAQSTALRALVKEPQVLLADEPTDALDEVTRGEFVELLEGVHRDRGLTLTVVTHDPWVAGRAARRLHLKRGKVTEKGAHALV